jgi:hypothetical protein
VPAMMINNGEFFALVVHLTLDAAVGRPREICPDCGPHGNRGRICLLWSWVDCERCEEAERAWVFGELGRKVTEVRGARRFDPEHPAEVELERLSPGRWRAVARVRRFLPEETDKLAGA